MKRQTLAVKWVKEMSASHGRLLVHESCPTT